MSQPETPASPPKETTPPRRELLKGDCWDEPYLYWRFLVALFKPGTAVPLAGKPPIPSTPVSARDIEEQTLIIEEARQEHARQAQTMQHNTTRAATLLTVSTAVLVFYATKGVTASRDNWLLAPPVVLGILLALLAVGGAAAVLTAQARYGTVNLPSLIDQPEPLRESLAQQYAETLSLGALTNAARVTVLRDGVLLAVVSGVLALVILAVETSKDPTGICKPPTGTTCTYTPIPSASASSSPMPATSTAPAPTTPSTNTDHATPSATESPATSPSEEPSPSSSTTPDPTP